MAYLYQTADPSLYGILKEFANKNRRFQTDAEQLLWQRLSKSSIGLPFRRQHIIGEYIADFVCLSKKLIIEVDGGYHSQYEQMLEDAGRTRKLESLGFRVIRFKNEEIETDISRVLDIIYNILVKL